MVETTANAANLAQKWDSEFFSQYVRASGYMPYMGKGSNNVIVVKKQLAQGGITLNIPLVADLVGAGVGANILEGNEEALGNANHAVTLQWVRNGVVIAKDQEHYTEFDMRMAAKDQLLNWAKNRLRSDLNAALSSITGVAYATATAGERNAWLALNADRVLFGAARSNNAGNVHATSLANCDAVNDLLTPQAISLMKVMAQTSSTAPIRPIGMKDETGEEYFVMFTDSLNFYYLSQNPTMVAANRDARDRNVKTNPLFQGGDLVWDGVIIKQIPEMPVVGAVGAASVNVSPAYLCGAQALAIAWGSDTKSKTDVRDYDFRYGVAIEEARGVSKVLFGAAGYQHGVVTGYFAAPTL